MKGRQRGGTRSRGIFYEVKKERRGKWSQPLAGCLLGPMLSMDKGMVF